MQFIPVACAIGANLTTDCALPGACACLRACERAHLLQTPVPYCFDVGGAALPPSPPSRGSATVLDATPLPPVDTFDELLAGQRIAYEWEHPLLPGAWNCDEINDANSGLHADVPPDKEVGSPHRCSFRGYIRADRCVCFQGWNGPLCDVPEGPRECIGPPCADACSHEGTCTWIEPPERARARPAVYVASLPPGFNVWRPRIAMNRNLAYEFWRRVTRSAHWTGTLDEADYVFVPVAPMGTISHGQVIFAVEHVRNNLKLVGTGTSKKTKLMVACPWDFGCSWLSGYPGMEDVTYLSHWGLTRKHKEYANTCTYCGPSYVPGKDLLVTDFLESYHQKHPFTKTLNDTRKTLVFFAGNPTSPLRQRVLSAFQAVSRSDIKIVSGAGFHLATEMDDARFCLALPGAGYGTRYTLAIVRGCIPVVIGDDITQPFEETFDLSTYGLRVAENNADDVLAIIEKVPLQREHDLRARIYEIRRHFVWDETRDDDAFATLMQSSTNETNAKASAENPQVSS